jgi:hypothetical protein
MMFSEEFHQKRAHLVDMMLAGHQPQLPATDLYGRGSRHMTTYGEQAIFVTQAVKNI